MKRISPEKSFQRILLINLAYMGDVLLSTPAARALRQAYPEAIIDFLVVPAVQVIADGNPYIDNVRIYDKTGKHKGLTGGWNLVKELRQEHYDLAVCTNFAPRGAMLACMLRIPYRIGYAAQHGSWFLTHAVSSRRSILRHEAEYYLEVLAPLQLPTVDTSLELAIEGRHRKNIEAKLRRTPGKKLLVLCPAGRNALKSWTQEGYIRLLQETAEQTDQVLIGSTKEQALLASLAEQAGGEVQVFAGSLLLLEIAALLSMADLLVTVDTGPMHIGQAVGVPTIALHGPTDPGQWGPRGLGDVVFYSPPSCAPCYCKAPPCDHSCMEDICQEAVLAAVRAKL